MNKNITKNSISLSDFNKNISAQERDFIDSEKKYYQIIVALKQKRQKLGLTQEQLARIANLPRTTITRVESGSRNATLQTLSVMANAMGKNVELRLI